MNRKNSFISTFSLLLSIILFVSSFHVPVYGTVTQLSARNGTWSSDNSFRVSSGSKDHTGLVSNEIVIKEVVRQIQMVMGMTINFIRSGQVASQLYTSDTIEENVLDTDSVKHNARGWLVRDNNYNTTVIIQGVGLQNVKITANDGRDVIGKEDSLYMKNDSGELVKVGSISPLDWEANRFQYFMEPGNYRFYVSGFIEYESLGDVSEITVAHYDSGYMMARNEYHKIKDDFGVSLDVFVGGSSDKLTRLSDGSNIQPTVYIDEDKLDRFNFDEIDQSLPKALLSDISNGIGNIICVTSEGFGSVNFFNEDDSLVEQVELESSYSYEREEDYRESVIWSIPTTSNNGHMYVMSDGVYSVELNGVSDSSKMTVQYIKYNGHGTYDDVLVYNEFADKRSNILYIPRYSERESIAAKNRLSASVCFPEDRLAELSR